MLFTVPRQLTLKRVAEKAGVSAGTAGRALGNPSDRSLLCFVFQQEEE
jgi:hypothetical protein